MNTLLRLKQDRKVQYIIAGSAALMALYTIYRLRNPNKAVVCEQSDSEIHQINDRILYEDNITDKHQFALANYPIEKNLNLSDILYKIILNFNKGNIYQGVVKLSFFVKSLSSWGRQFRLHFNGTSIKYLSVNGQVLKPQEITYDNHSILFDKKHLNEKQINKVEVIFENKYSFLDDGLSSYFILDDSNKYSLKEQVIYTKNGPYQIERIMPCLNVLNECKVSLQVIYPQGFQAFSNSPKSLERLCTAQQYPQYSFFFSVPERGLNKSFKLNSSFTGSNFDNSTLNASSQTKRNSHFYTSSLLSIHNLFAFCSNVVEVQHHTAHNDSKILVRYFCKHTKLESIGRHVSTLNRHVIDICNRLSEYKLEKHLTKIDVFFVNDKEIHGYFVPGAILLDEQSVSNGVHIKTFYLLARAVLGMLKAIDYRTHFFNQKLPPNSPLRNHLTLEVNLQLNELICQKFPECRAYLFFKQQAIQKARGFLHKKEFLERFSLRFLQYYYKESRFLLTDKALKQLEEKLPFQYKDLNARLQTQDPLVFWSHFVTQYNFLSPYLAELLLKIAIAKKGAPLASQQITQFAKKNFSKSKYYLAFFTNDEIQNNLQFFMEGRYPKLQNRLTQIKIKEKFREFITDQYESYLPIKSNKQQAKSIYDQFKRFKENRNFHHVSVLKHEIKRINMFGSDFITRENLNLECGFMSWKLMTKIQIFPASQDYKRLISELQQVSNEYQEQKANRRSKDFQKE